MKNSSSTDPSPKKEIVTSLVLLILEFKAEPVASAILLDTKGTLAVTPADLSKDA